jgi:hypothetical protein
VSPTRSASLLACALALAGCVTVKKQRAGVPIAKPIAGTGLPPWPVAKPAESAATNTSRLQLTVQPLGTTDYDGQTLPLVCPDGSAIAVQRGQPPTLDVLLGDARVSGATQRIVILRPRDGGLGELDATPSLPPRTFLGRDADNEGFLVECVPRDGERWIGKVPWTGGPPRWIVSEGSAAQGVLLPGGALACTIAEDAGAALLVVCPDGSRAVYRRPGASLAFPMPGPADSILVHALDPTGKAEMLCVRGMVRGDAKAGVSGGVSARTLSGETSLADIYEASAGWQPSCSTGGSDGGGGARALFTSRSLGGVAEATLLERAGLSLRTLIPGAVAGVAWTGSGTCPPGVFATTREGLIFRADAHGATTRVLAKPYVPRAVTTWAGPALLLIGPDGRRGEGVERLEVLRLHVDPPQ